MLDKILLAPCEIADLLGVSMSTTYRWISAGRIKHVKLGHLVRVEKEELLRWIRSNQRNVS